MVDLVADLVEGLVELERGERIVDDTFLVLLNAHHEPVPFVLPAHRRGVRWELVLDTRAAGGHPRQRLARGGASYALDGRSLVLFRMRALRERAT